jgi:hypothetical protein
MIISETIALVYCVRVFRRSTVVACFKRSAMAVDPVFFAFPVCLLF